MHMSTVLLTIPSMVATTVVDVQLEVMLSLNCPSDPWETTLAQPPVSLHVTRLDGALTDVTAPLEKRSVILAVRVTVVGALLQELATSPPLRARQRALDADNDTACTCAARRANVGRSSVFRGV